MADLREKLERLAAFRPEAGMVTSLYIHLRPEERQDNKYLRIFKDMVREKKGELGRRNLPGKALDSIERDFEKIGEFLSEPKNLEGCRGLAVFSCSREGLFEVLKLPYVYRNRLMVAPDPLIREIFEKPGYLCPETHLIFLKPECPLEGEEPIQIEDIVDEVIEEALDQRAAVEVVVKEELQRRIDGLAAFLRFSL